MMCVNRPVFNRNRVSIVSVQLPQAFAEKMKRLLGEEWGEFLASYEQSRAYGLRVNTLKISAEEFRRISPFKLEPVPWTDSGFYYEEGERPGKHPYYHAGLYYIQEPSAMAPVELLDVQPGDRVLDLCAAPGGKSTQIAAKLAGSGLLVSNDNHPDRAKALVKNIELFGIRNAAVLNEWPERLKETFRGFFTKILIDAPCSGEGMFRKEEDMVKSWEKHSVEHCTVMQKDILRHAAEMLGPGGRIVYSTCTFSPEENEAVIAEFLDQHKAFEVVQAPMEHGFAHGRGDWLDGAGEFLPGSMRAVKGTVRLWPHRLRGEGHFAAVLQKRGALPLESVDSADNFMISSDQRVPKREKSGKAISGKGSGTAGTDLSAAVSFMEEHLDAYNKDRIKRWTMYGSHVYEMPPGLPPLDGLKVVRPGWHLGMLKKARFEPSQALAMGLSGQEFARRVLFSSADEACIRYLKGETLHIAEDRIVRHDALPAKGYCLVCADGYPLGWGKWIDGILKNEYPPAWRWN
jgi:NOL1/NOP2/sun family putative RNA methylase